MNYIAIAALILISIYPLSYAKYNWDRKNKFSAMGCILLVMLSIVMAVIELWRK